MADARLLNLVLATAFVLMAGWILFLGQATILPIVGGLISVYVLSTAADKLQHLRFLGATPLWLRRLLVLLAFVALISMLALMVVLNVQGLMAVLPGYEDNLISLVSSVTEITGLENVPSWDRIRAVTIGRVDLESFIGTLLSSTTSLGGQLFLLVVYTAFLLAERVQFAEKFTHAVATVETADRMLEVFHEINSRIGNYLAIKTLINLILGVISFLIMWLIGIDFAVFWAVLIGLLNYIPYFGSLLGVMFPVLLSLAQFGSFYTALLSLILLTAVQAYVGNVLEPRMIGRTVNLSPFVVLVALSVWTTLWGLPGAILAIPMTSMIVIILAAIESTRPIAIMLSSDGEV